MQNSECHGSSKRRMTVNKEVLIQDQADCKAARQKVERQQLAASKHCKCRSEQDCAFHHKKRLDKE